MEHTNELGLAIDNVVTAITHKVTKDVRENVSDIIRVLLLGEKVVADSAFVPWRKRRPAQKAPASTRLVPPGYIDIKAVSHILGMKPLSIHTAINRGRFPVARKIGGRLYWAHSAILARKNAAQVDTKTVAHKRGKQNESSKRGKAKRKQG